MLSKIVKIIMGAVVAAGIMGCSQHAVVQRESRLDKNWGRSFESARYNQILNLEAEKNLEPVKGLYGPVAERIMEGYIGCGVSKQKPSTKCGVGTIKK
jgi:hypothetical protein